MASSTPPAAVGGYRALADNTEFRTLLLAEILLFGGEALFMTVLPWLALEATGSNSAVGWVMSATYLPFLLLALPAGTLADRMDRRRLLIAVNLLRAVVIGSIPVLYSLHALRGWQVLLVAFLRAALSMLFVVARDASVPQIIPRQELVTANAVRTLFIGLAMMMGSALVGPVVRALGLGNAPAVYVASLLLSAGCLARLRLPAHAAPVEPQQGLSWRDLLQGVSFAWRDPLVRGMLMLEVVYFTFGDGPITVGLPLFVKQVLHAGPEAYGYIRTANYLGLMVAALWLGQYGRRVHKGQVILIGWLGWGLALIGYPLFRSLSAALVAGFVSNLMGNLIPMCEGTLIQERVSHDMLGRVSGVWNMIAPGWGVFSGLAGGALAGSVPAATLVLVGAAASCCNALLGLRAGLWKER